MEVIGTPDFNSSGWVSEYFCQYGVLYVLETLLLFTDAKQCVFKIFKDWVPPSYASHWFSPLYQPAPPHTVV